MHKITIFKLKFNENILVKYQFLPPNFHFLAESEASETESTSSLESRIVENDWSDFEISEPITASIESQESSIAENYDLAMKAFANGHLDDAFRRFLELSKNPVLVQQQVADFRNFDWVKAKKDYRPANLTILKQYFFAVHRNLAKFMRDPTLNYLHVRGHP